MFDTLIANATVFSGRNEPPTQTNVALIGDKIAAIDASLSPDQAKQMIDATGLYLAPGFIDPHASTGFGYYFPNAADHKLYQGITTEIFGNCGTSPAPIGPRLDETMERLSEEIGFPFTWHGLTEYFGTIQDNLQFNIATLVGHSTLRAGHVEDWPAPTAAEQVTMREALATAMDEGALGFSSGLIYAPGCFADTEELIELAKVTKEKGGVYASHIRNERDELLEAVEEALTIGQGAGIKVLVSHLKAAEKPNWGKIPKVLERLERYNRESGLEARVDVYPYTAVSTKLRAFIPKHYLQDGMQALPAKLREEDAVTEIATYIEQKGYGLENMMVISNDIPLYHNKTVREIAADLGISEAQAMAKIIADNTETWIVYHCISEEDMDLAVTWDKAMICTDSWSYPINAPTVIGQPHPRSYGAFTTFLERYVLDKKLLGWAEALHKITDMPATFFQLEKRGQIKEGYFADLVAFAPDEIKANATYLAPKELSEGMKHVWINGQLTIEAGKIINNAKNGRVLTL